MHRKPTTLHDVAAASGVSVPTVSKVLNGRGRVAPQTRERILTAARDLDFRPNALAQSFVRGRSGSVGILTQRAFGGFTMPVLTGAHAEFGRQGLTTLLYAEHFAPDRLDENFKQMQARRTDGVLVIGDGPDEPIRSFTEVFRGPVVTVFGLSERPTDLSIIPDGRQAGRLAVEHLIGIGRRSIALITADDLAAREREAGAADTLHAAGLDFCSPPLRGDWSSSWGLRATEILVQRAEPFDAVICGNDQIAQAAAHVLIVAGRSIPDDVALVGYDNDAAVFGRADSFLTTIDPRLSELGAIAARTLSGAVERERSEAGGEAPAGVVRTPVALIPGPSTLGDSVT